MEAQICTGSLGDPAINITFGPQGNAGAGFIPPGYIYTSSTCPNDGYYTITPGTNGCFSNAWHPVNNDHTGQGNFMLVNASNEPSDFFVANLNDLCPATTYQFSAWVMNLLLTPSGIKPNITFTVETPDGVILNQFNTGGIFVTAQPQHGESMDLFTTSAGNPNIVLRMRNNAPGGAGNDLALDDITFRPCSPALLQASVRGSDDIVDRCTGDQSVFDFDATLSAGLVSPVFQWQLSLDSGKLWTDIAGATSMQYQRAPTGTGMYWYRLTVAEFSNNTVLACRITSGILKINIHPKPVVNAGPDRILIAGRSIVMTATVITADPSYNWSPPDYLNDPALFHPLVTAPQDMEYLLSVISAYGCTNSDAVKVKVVAGVFVPTGFTPNNDGKNDRWAIPYLDPQLNATVSVYNRWGQLLYQVRSAAVGWDGNFKKIPQPAGTYIYHIHFKDGTPDMKGTLNLIR